MNLRQGLVKFLTSLLKKEYFWVYVDASAQPVNRQADKASGGERR